MHNPTLSLSWHYSPSKDPETPVTIQKITQVTLINKTMACLIQLKNTKLQM